MTVRYGLLGSGWMGQEHINNIKLVGGEVTAIMDPDQAMRDLSLQNAGKQAQAFDNLSDCISADLCDAYVIVAPNNKHHEILLDIIPGNKPILCEKPLCTTAADCRDVVSKAHNRTAPIWVAMEYRYMPPVQRLLEEVNAGTAGELKMLSIREHRFPFLQKVGDWNRFNANTGGTLTEKCCHFWDLMRLVLQSNPTRVYASAAADVNHQDERYGGAVPDIIDNAYVVVDFENGARGMLDLCMFAEGSYWQEVISATGPKARIDACIPAPARFSAGEERAAELHISDRESQQVDVQKVHVDEAILHAGDHHGSTYFQHLRFIDLVRKGQGAPEVTLEDGLWSVIVGEAAERSAATGEAVSVSL